MTLAQEQQLRVDLAASFQIAAHYNWHEGIANHFSAAVSDDGLHFLLNPKWKHFARIRAADLLLLDSRDDAALEKDNAPDPTAWHLHGAVHARVPQVRCLMHLHLPYATVLSCLDDCSIQPIDQTTSRFFNRVAIDKLYGGMVDNASEGARVAEMLSRHDVIVLGNHGVLVAGRSVAAA
ncbi:MAG TPA: class II aldolase/adducin family protein, partial [Pseudorhodoferax sp.]|nr:class II aldolase/adducin family protein [Pseudorhodoferax sp.]